MSPLIISIIFISFSGGHIEYGLGTCAVKTKPCTEKNTIAINSSSSSRNMAQDLAHALDVSHPATNSAILYTGHISDQDISVMLKEIEK